MSTKLRTAPPEMDAQARELLATAILMSGCGEPRTHVMTAVQMVTSPLILDALERGDDHREVLVMIMQGVAGALGGLLAKVDPTGASSIDRDVIEHVAEQMRATAISSRDAIRRGMD